MALDGITLFALKEELREKLLNSRIDKVYQPEGDELLLNIRGADNNYKLLISASSSHPRMYITEDYNKKNPKKAPLFCMFLRKHIQGGRIVDIEQIGFDRIIKIKIETLDELRNRVIKNLYVEIMGRHSNIILVNEDTNLILDSIKRISHNISSVRQVLPGIGYELAPSHNKVDISKSLDENFVKISLSEFKGPVYKYIYSTYEGFSPLTAREVCYRGGIDKDLNTIIDMWDEDVSSLMKGLRSFYEDINNKNFSTCLIVDEKKDKIVAFSAYDINQYEEFTKITEDNVSRVLEKYFNSKDNKERINQRTSNLRKSLLSKLERQKNKIVKIDSELLDSEHADEYRLKGELLTTYMHMIKPGMDKVEVENYYSKEMDKMEIEVNPNISPSENAQRYYKKYNKLKHAKNALNEQKKLALEEVEYLESIILALDYCETDEEIKDIRNELIRLGYIKSRRMPSKKEMTKNTMADTFISSNGIKILVGKNNRQNDYLTLRLSEGDDIWLHTKNIPGSHVLIKCAGKKLDAQTLEEAAILAGYFSKAKNQTKVEVDYTQKKNVKKPSGAKPGMVIYEKNKTIVIDATEENYVKIKGR